MDFRLESGASLPPGGARGWTLIEVIIAIAVVAILSTIGVVMYHTSVHTTRVTKCIAEIKVMQMDLDNYNDVYGEYPLALEEVGHQIRRDPWDRSYVYTKFVVGKNGKVEGVGQKVRKDKKLKPLNLKYDLFSMGPDGDWKAALTAKASRDDIIRANDGGFVGIAELY